MRKINPKNIRYIPKRSRHIRWHWEESPDNHELVRYHVVVVGDKKIEQPIDNILQQVNSMGPAIQLIREVRGDVGDSRFKYLFKSFDTSISPTEIDWSKTNLPRRKDKNLYERKRGSIEDYVADLYK